MFSNAFVDRDLMAKMTAKMLLEVEAVHFNAEKSLTHSRQGSLVPFILTAVN